MHGSRRAVGNHLWASQAALLPESDIWILLPSAHQRPTIREYQAARVGSRFQRRERSPRGELSVAPLDNKPGDCFVKQVERRVWLALGRRCVRGGGGRPRRRLAAYTGFPRARRSRDHRDRGCRADRRRPRGPGGQPLAIAADSSMQGGANTFYPIDGVRRHGTDGTRVIRRPQST